MVRARIRSHPRLSRHHLPTALPAVRHSGGHAVGRVAAGWLVRSRVREPCFSPCSQTYGRRGEHHVSRAGVPPRRDRDGANDRVDRGEARPFRQVRSGHLANRLPQPTGRIDRRGNNIDDRPTLGSAVAREQIFYEDVHPGDTLPTLAVTADERQLFFFSAATYNGHRIHYDKDWARTVENYDDVIVQGPLQAALLARAITDWIGGRGRLVEYSVQNRAVAIAGEELNFGGSVTAKRLADNIGLVDLEIAGRRGDTVLMPGTATVALPLRGDQP